MFIQGSIWKAPLRVRPPLVFSYFCMLYFAFLYSRILYFWLFLFLYVLIFVKYFCISVYGSEHWKGPTVRQVLPPFNADLYWLYRNLSPLSQSTTPALILLCCVLLYGLDPTPSQIAMLYYYCLYLTPTTTCPISLYLCFIVLSKSNPVYHCIARCFIALSKSNPRLHSCYRGDMSVAHLSSLWAKCKYFWKIWPKVANAASLTFSERFWYFSL